MDGEFIIHVSCFNGAEFDNLVIKAVKEDSVIDLLQRIKPVKMDTAVQSSNALREANLDCYDFWDPEQSRWLRPRSRQLRVHNIITDCRLELWPSQYEVYIKLPDLQMLQLTVSFVSSVYQVVRNICQLLSISHHDRFSLLHVPFDDNRAISPSVASKQLVNSFHYMSHRSISRQASSSISSPMSTGDKQCSPLSNNCTYGSLRRRNKRISSPSIVAESMTTIQFPRNFDAVTVQTLDKCYSPTVEEISRDLLVTWLKSARANLAMNKYWIDSTKSLMDQGVRPNGKVVMMLRVKYAENINSFAATDDRRLSMTYHQMRCDFLSKILTFSPEEVLLLACLESKILQDLTAATIPHKPQVNGCTSNISRTDNIDYLDSMLSSLETPCASSPPSEVVYQCDATLSVVRRLRFARPMVGRLSQQNGVFTFISGSRETQFNRNCCSFIRSSLAKNRVIFTHAGQGGMHKRKLKLLVTDVEMFRKVLSLLTVQEPTANDVLVTENELCPATLFIMRYLKSFFSELGLSLATESANIMKNLHELRFTTTIEAKQKFVDICVKHRNAFAHVFLVTFHNSSEDEYLRINSNGVDRGTSLLSYQWHCSYLNLLKWSTNVRNETITLYGGPNFGELTFSSRYCSCNVIHELIAGYVHQFQEKSAPHCSLTDQEKEANFLRLASIQSAEIF